jgi:hypothetical protein
LVSWLINEKLASERKCRVTALTGQINQFKLPAQVVHYIGQRSKTDIQMVVISLKEEMYNKADALIGIYPKAAAPCISSGILTYDLENFNLTLDNE